jgi:hypothetical protein
MLGVPESESSEEERTVTRSHCGLPMLGVPESESSEEERTVTRSHCGVPTQGVPESESSEEERKDCRNEKKKKKRTRKRDCTLPSEVEKKAVEWLHAHEILWNPEHEQRNRTDLIQDTWEQFSDAIGYSG